MPKHFWLLQIDRALQVGGADNDSLAANPVATVLYGKGWDDTLTGNTGSDTFYGGAGNDTLRGGLGADSYYFNPTEQDVIYDNGRGDSTAALDTLVLETSDTLTGTASDDVMSGLDGDDTVDGSENDTLYEMVFRFPDKPLLLRFESHNKAAYRQVA